VTSGRVAWIALAAAACGGDGAPAEPDAAGACSVEAVELAATIPLAGACPAAQRVGGFAVTDSGLFSAIQGQVLAGVIPSLVPEELAVDGDCALHRRRNPFCNPPCGGDQTCDLDGQCIPFPAALDVGTIELRSQDACFALTARPPGNNYFKTDVPHPVVAVDAVVELAAGGALGVIRLHGVGVEPLPATRPSWTVTRGQSLVVSGRNSL
jgi:hypothetical protein